MMDKQASRLRVINGSNVRPAHEFVYKKVRNAHIFLVPLLDERGFELPDKKNTVANLEDLPAVASQS